MDVTPDDKQGGPPERPVPPDRHAQELQRLVHVHGAGLMEFVRRLVPPDLTRLIDAQDVVQDTYFEAFQRLAEFCPRDEGAALRWLKTIARNRLIDLVRRHRSAKRDSRRTADEVRRGSVILMLQELATYSRTPSRSAAAHEFLGAFQQTLGGLPPDYRDAIQYRYVDGLTFKEVAARMDRTEDATRMLTARGLRALRARMGSLSQFT
jgi:RNA polymerase sigma-70 factor, ECF subfamily